MKTKNTMKAERIRLLAIMIISLFVISTGSLFATHSFKNGEVAGGVLGILIAIIILVFAIFVCLRGNSDLKHGFPLKDERSKKIIDKASSRAFYISLYLLLIIGFLSDDVIKFRDISQATGVAVGGMAILFGIFWAYYNKKQV
ncbi:MAG: DUF2178 domain-containing protein [archaeon]